MLYAMQDALVRSMAPWAALAEFGTRVMGSTVPALQPMVREAQARLRLLGRLTKSYDKPAFNLDSVLVDGVACPVTEEVAATLPFCTLRHFRKDSGPLGPKVLIVAPLSGHHSTLLRATVLTMLEKHDVYITDWVDARQVPVEAGSFDLSSYTQYVQQFVRLLGPDVNVLAVCQPCVPVLAAISLMEQNNEKVVPKSLILIAGPVDVRNHPTAVNQFATEHDLNYFKDNLIEPVPSGYLGARRKVYPGFMQLTGFVLMNKDKHAEAYANFYRAVVDGEEDKAVKHEAFYDEYNAVLDMPAEYYLETIEKIFLRPDLARGELTLCGELVTPKSIRRTALLTIEGDKDDITGLGQTHAAQTLCESLSADMREQLTVQGAGHYGAFSGTKFKTVAMPVITDFIKAHS